MIYQLFTKSENTGWNKQLQTMSKEKICYIVQEFQADKKKAIKKGHLIIDVKVRIA